MENENWVPCKKCGSPRLQIDRSLPPEPCADCLSRSSPWGAYLGSVSIGLAVAAILGVVFGSLVILL